MSESSQETIARLQRINAKLRDDAARFRAEYVSAHNAARRAENKMWSARAARLRAYAEAEKATSAAEKAAALLERSTKNVDRWIAFARLLAFTIKHALKTALETVAKEV